MTARQQLSVCKKNPLICYNRVTNKGKDIFIIFTFMHGGNQEPIGEVVQKESWRNVTAREMKYEILSLNIKFNDYDSILIISNFHPAEGSSSCCMADVSLAKLTHETYLKTLATNVFTCSSQDWDREVQKTVGNLQLESQIPLFFLFPNPSLPRTMQSNIPLHFKLSFKQTVIERITF